MAETSPPPPKPQWRPRLTPPQSPKYPTLAPLELQCGRQAAHPPLTPSRPALRLRLSPGRRQRAPRHIHPSRHWIAWTPSSKEGAPWRERRRRSTERWWVLQAVPQPTPSMSISEVGSLTVGVAGWRWGDVVSADCIAEDRDSTIECH